MSFMRKLIGPFLFLLLVVAVFRSWFFPGLLSAFDFPYYSPLMIKSASIFPYAWGWHIGFDGFAGFLSPYSWVFPLIYIPQIVFGNLGMDWAFIERITYLYPLLILLLFSPIVLFRTIFPKNKFYLFSIIIFSFNTYALLLASGEVFVALAYSLIPVILAIFIKIINSIKYSIFSIKYSVIAGIIISLQIMLDPRVTYVTISMVALYAIFSILYLVFSKKLIKQKIFNTLYLILYVFIIPGIIAFLLQAFWILPTVFYGVNPVKSLGAGYSSLDAVKFLSFAKLENTISLLHSNWPENIFGKVYFMRPEFLILPILAYVSLFFIPKIKDQKTKIYILFFALLGIIGAFLAKGSNEPFGVIYQWMFNYFPGFIMFRDPAKWYPLVAVSYSILIPFSIWKIYEWLRSQSRFMIYDLRFMTKNKVINVQNLFLLLFISYLLFLIRPALLGQVGGLLKTTSVPSDYLRLEKFLADKPNYFRTLWVPSKQKFGYYSNNHPEISAQTLFNNSSINTLSKKLSEQTAEIFLEEISVKYVIVPYDSEKEIFLKDRKYDEKLYKKTIKDVEKIKWLKKINGFGKIAVFEVPNPKDHFYISNQQPAISNQRSAISNQEVSYQYISSVEYSVTVKNVKKGDRLVFTESFDSKWVAKTSDYTLRAIRYNLFNSFVLPKDGNYSLKIYYTPQDFVNIGIVISVGSFIISLILLILLFKKK